MVPFGPILFKLLMQNVTLDTWATSSLMSNYVSNLDSYKASVKSDVEEFNRFVILNYQGI